MATTRFAPRRACGVERRVSRQIVARERKRLCRAVDRQHLGGPARERGEREASRVAERVQHAPIPRVAADERAVVALVEIEARLLPMRDIDAVGDAGFDDVDDAVAPASHGPRARHEPFECPHLGVRALEDAACAGGRRERIDDRVAPAFRAGRRQLNDDGVCVAVGDDARKPVRLAVDEPARVMACIDERRAGRHRAFDACGEKRRIDRGGRIERPDAGADPRGRRIRAAAEKAAVRGDDLYRVSGRGRSVDGLDGAREDPGMAQQQRALAAWCKPQRRTCRARGVRQGRVVSRWRCRARGRARTSRRPRPRRARASARPSRRHCDR